jgi:hypothetical protein
MKGTEATCPEPVADSAFGDSQFEQLATRDDAVLAPQQPPDLAVLSNWDRYSGPK